MSEKPTYEQLEQVAQNLNEQCKMLYGKLREAEQMINNFNDLGLLLAILKQSEYFSDSFVDKCSAKIEAVISPMLDKAEEQEE